MILILLVTVKQLIDLEWPYSYTCSVEIDKPVLVSSGIEFCIKFPVLVSRSMYIGNYLLIGFLAHPQAVHLANKASTSTILHSSVIKHKEEI